MRVIAGALRSRRLVSAPGLDTRPTPDRLRESLFSILAPRLEGAVFVDLYAGTGAVGIEALSRGASRAIFVERGHALHWTPCAKTFARWVSRPARRFVPAKSPR